MKHFLFSVYTGPVIVKQISQKMFDVSILVLFTGTERIFFFSDGLDTDNAIEVALSKMKKKYNTDFHLRPSKVREISDANYQNSIRSVEAERLRITNNSKEDCPPTLKNDR